MAASLGAPPRLTPTLASPRIKATGRRFRRWHLDATPPAEDEAWLLTYLDVITLMLVMMVVMLAHAGSSDHAADGHPASQATATSMTSQATPTPAPITLPVPKAETAPRQAAPSPDLPPPLPGQQDQQVEVIADTQAVRFRLSSEWLFSPGGADLMPASHPLLDELIPTLNADSTLRLVIEGHTDNTPIRSARFPSNWELSTSRAAAVARYLAEHGVAPQRIQASGFADTRPLGAKDNPVDRQANRRVDLVMEKAPLTR